jgi:hypothetical protein
LTSKTQKIYEEKIGGLQMLKSKKNRRNQEMPQEPKFKVVYIPANTSNAKIIQH